MGCGVICLLGLIALAVYFVPTIIALARHHHQAGMIVILNIFLGWTFIGWVVSLATAFSHTGSTAADRHYTP
jgi:hypothetical protein